MNYVVTPEQLDAMTQAFTVTGRAALVADASDLGFPPGAWPQLITIDGVDVGPPAFSRGEDGEVYLAKYGSPACPDFELHILND